MAERSVPAVDEDGSWRQDGPVRKILPHTRPALPGDTRPAGQPARRPPFTWAGCREGARLTFPLWPGLAVFGAAYGAAAAQKGMSLGTAVGASAFVFGGAAQMVALELWREPLDVATVLGLVGVTLLINARMILMGASLQPWMRRAPAAQNVVQLFFLVDANWIVATRYHAAGGRDLGVLFGAGVALWPLWVATTGIGHAAGALVRQPAAFGLDFIVPALFVAMLVPIWRGPRPALPWLASGLAALAAQRFLPGYAFVIVGALAGLATGALADDRQ